MNRSTPSCGAGRHAIWHFDFQKKGVRAAAFDTRVKNYVFARSLPQSPVPPGVEFVNEPIKVFATRLRQKKGEDIWMMGARASLRRFSMKERSASSSFNRSPYLLAKTFH
jgi:hypothetical protein